MTATGVGSAKIGFLLEREVDRVLAAAAIQTTGRGPVGG
jgi:hypothetical protein